MEGGTLLLPQRTALCCCHRAQTPATTPEHGPLLLPQITAPYCYYVGQQQDALWKGQQQPIKAWLTRKQHLKGLEEQSRLTDRAQEGNLFQRLHHRCGRLWVRGTT